MELRAVDISIVVSFVARGRLGRLVGWLPMGLNVKRRERWRDGGAEMSSLHRGVDHQPD